MATVQNISTNRGVGLVNSHVASGKVSPNISDHTANPPDQFSVVVQQARAIRAKSQSGLLPKASTNTGHSTNVLKMEKTIGDLADLVENTFDPVWKETYRIALVRALASVQKSGTGATVASASSISGAGVQPDTFSHPAVGLVPGLDVSSWSARQAGYQQRFNPPPPATMPPFLPVDPAASGNEYNRLDIPGQATTAIPTQTNPTGSFVAVRGKKAFGVSHK